MVKNTTGGSKHKSFARKNFTHNIDSFPTPQNDGECFAIVTKMLGNGMCHVDLLNQEQIIHNVICHIRGKFRNKNKRNNLVTIHSIILVGLRTWTNNLNACDLIFVYSSHHTNSLPIHKLTLQHQQLNTEHNFSFSLHDDHTSRHQHHDTLQQPQHDTLQQPQHDLDHDDDIDIDAI